tara:strand:- start:7418 stop:7654 length:237 start_codon:yes stop_codon:yes gene_type:complete
MLHKVLLIVSVGILLGACVVTPTYNPGTLVWVGCHKVEQNPSPEGSKALGMLAGGTLMYLQQINSRGESNVTVGRICK